MATGDGQRPRFDPSYDAALGPLAAAMNAYVREELKFDSDLPYKVLTGVGPWPQDQNRYASTASQLADAMSRNHHLRVLVQTGAATWPCPIVPMGTRSTISRSIPLSEPTSATPTYDSGHMMYLRLEDLAKLERDLRAFLEPPPADTPAGQ